MMNTIWYTNNLWYRQTDYIRKEGGTIVRRNATSTEEYLGAMGLRTKPDANPWLYLSPLLCTLGQDAFDHAPAVIRVIYQHLKATLDAREEAGANIIQLMQEIITMSVEQFQVNVLATRDEYKISDATSAGMGMGWTPAFFNRCYPRASIHLKANFVRDFKKLSVGLVLALDVTFGNESFVKGSAVLLTQVLTDLRLDGLLTLIIVTYVRLGDLFVRLSYLEQLRGSKREFDVQLETAS